MSDDSDVSKPLHINPVPQTYVVPPPPRDVVVGHIVHLILSVVILILSVCSLFLPWLHVAQFQSPLYGGQNMESSVTLWKTTTTITGMPKQTQDVKDYCWPVSRRVRVIEAFACATAAAALVSVILGVFNVRSHGAKEGLRTACCALSIVTFICAVIASSFFFSVYYWSFADCGAQSSFHSHLYEPSYGTGFFITAWVLTFFAGLIVPNNATIALDARSIDSAIFLFTLFAFIGTLFACVSCPVQHWFYKNGATAKATDVTLWKTQEGNFDWNILATTAKDTIWRKDYTCSKLVTMFKAAGGVSIAATSLNFIAFVWGLLIWQCLTSIVLPAIIFSILGFFTAIAQFIIETLIFYNDWCDGAYAYRKQKFVLGAGYALCAASFCVMLVASICIIIAYVGIKKFFPSKLTRKPEAKQHLD